jgi:putative ABC transport system substrate-binding protein
MSRRRLLWGLVLLLSTAPLAAHARSQSARRKIAYLVSDGELTNACVSGTPASSSFYAFRDGLRELGYRQGQNVEFECRSAEGKYERLDGIAAEFVRIKPDVIVASAVPASLAVKRATSTIPIVSVYTADPVGVGLVASLRRPGGNVTGVSALAADYAAKSLELLKEAAPRVSRVGILGDGRNPTFKIYRQQLEGAGQALGLAIEFVSIETVPNLEATLVAMRKRGTEAILLMHQPFTYVHGKSIADIAARHRLPTMYGNPEAVEAGGLMSYAVNVPAVFRHSAYIVDKILKGAKPAELPVEQPTRFELVINLRTAKTLGLAIPPSLLVRADRVIE